MNRQCRGVLLMDAMFALVAIGVILASLLAAAGQFRGGLRRLDDHHRAARVAEGLGALARRGRDLPLLQLAAAEDGCAVELHELEQAADAPGWTWVELRVVREGATVTLVTLAPAAAGVEASP